MSDGSSQSGAGERVLVQRRVCIGAAFVAAWLAGRVANRGGLAIEKRIEPAAAGLPRGVKAAAYGFSALAYPITYLPLSLWIANGLRRRGSRSADIVPRAALAAWMTHHAIKSLADRERPPVERGSANDDRSYPSGHATAAAAIAVATVLAARGDGTLDGGLATLVAAPALLIGASRVALRKHWPTDVIGGWATGVAVATYLAANN